MFFLKKVLTLSTLIAISSNSYAEECSSIELEALAFGHKIQEAFANKDNKALAEMMSTRTDTRIEYVRDSDFNDLFDPEFVDKLVREDISCKRFNYDGWLMMGGSLWYSTDGYVGENGTEFKIISLPAKPEFIPDEDLVFRDSNNTIISPSCLVTVPYYGSGEEVFLSLEDIYKQKLGFDRDSGKNFVYKFAYDLSQCDNEGYTIKGNRVYLDENHVEDSKANSYQAVKKLPNSLCESKAPSFPGSMSECQILEVSQPTGASYTSHYAIYGISNFDGKEILARLGMFSERNGLIDFIVKNNLML